ncbi:MAG: HAD-IA family hydrolase [Pseudomonadota bacterium]
MPINAVIFDLDGTLIDSAADLHLAANQMLDWQRRKSLDFETVKGFVGNGAEALVSRCLNATGGHDNALLQRALTEFLQIYQANGIVHTRVFPGVIEMLEACRTNELRLGICTNKPQPPTELICSDLGVDGYFDAIIGATKEIPRKPDPAPLLHCLSKLKATRDEVLFVGDSVVDHQTAQAANVPFALFTGGILNGVLEPPEPVIQFGEWHADCLIEAL